MRLTNLKVSSDDHLWTATIEPSELLELLTSPHKFVERMGHVLRDHFTLVYNEHRKSLVDYLLKGSEKHRDLYVAWGIEGTGIVMIEGDPREEPMEFEMPLTVRRLTSMVVDDGAAPVGAIHGDVGDPVLMARLLYMSIRSRKALGRALSNLTWTETTMRMPSHGQAQADGPARAVQVAYEFGPDPLIFYEGTSGELPEGCYTGQFISEKTDARSLTMFGGKTNPVPVPPGPVPGPRPTITVT